MLYVSNLSRAVGSSGFSGISGTSGSSGYSGVGPSWTKITTNTNAVASRLYICDTSSGPFTLTLPASPLLGDTIVITDGSDFTANNLTIGNNGKNIEGVNDSIIVDINNVLIYFTYDGTQWQVAATSGPKGDSGYSGTSGLSGYSGTSGSIGISGTSGSIGISGTSGANGVSGFSGTSGTSGLSGYSGTSGSIGVSGTSGSIGISGTSGANGVSGFSGTSGYSGTSGSIGISGTSGSIGISGTSGANGVSGFSGTSGTSGTSGYSGTSGSIGISGTSGANGVSGFSGTSGTSGVSGYSGTLGVSGVSGTSGASTVGRQTMWIPATSMTPRITNGPSNGLVEATTNKNLISTLDFDTTTQEFAQFDVRMPKSWNEGTVTFAPTWSHATTTVNFGVVWALDAVAISDNETLDVAFGTEQTSTDTGGTANRIYIGPESAAITIANTPAPEDYVMFRIKRNPANASDTMAIDARLHGITIYYTTDTFNDV